ncbi:hypothetical protein WKK05_11570 [Nostoc sp. UHCC 0302]|uniref:TolB family protein n=1 Tax=Nostoc sp. UHCC 0302 TaxID=3134896 RepID=UPI00311C8AAF
MEIFTIIAAEGNITQPVWSPNGQRLAFVQLSANGAYVVYAVNADGSGLTKLFSDNKCSPISPQFNGVWSSDSQNLVFEKICPFDDPQTESPLYTSRPHPSCDGDECHAKRTI